MMRQPEPYEWVSVHEASRRLSRSVSTIRRMIEAGELVGEREPLGGSRDRYRVRLPKDMPQDASGDASPSESPIAPPDASETPQDAPALTMRMLEFMDTLLRANGETMERQAETISALRERIGRAEERAIAADRRADQAERERAAMTAALEAAEQRLTEAREQAARSWWRRILGR